VENARGVMTSAQWVDWMTPARRTREVALGQGIGAGLFAAVVVVVSSGHPQIGDGAIRSARAQEADRRPHDDRTPPPASGGLNLFQKEPLFRRPERLVGGVERPSPPANSPPTSGSLSSLWLSMRSLLPRREIGPSPGRPRDYWKPGEFDRLIGR